MRVNPNTVWAHIRENTYSAGGAPRKPRWFDVAGFVLTGAILGGAAVLAFSH